jgi:hypothetical protein
LGGGGLVVLDEAVSECPIFQVPIREHVPR